MRSPPPGPAMTNALLVLAIPMPPLATASSESRSALLRDGRASTIRKMSTPSWIHNQRDRAEWLKSTMTCGVPSGVANACDQPEGPSTATAGNPTASPVVVLIATARQAGSGVVPMTRFRGPEPSGSP